MFNYLVNLLKENKLVKNSAVFFTGTMLVNFGNYLYQLIMARLLPVAAYGELLSLLSILVIFSIPLGVVSLIIIKYSAKFKGLGEPEKIHKLFTYFTSKLLWAGIIFYFIVALAASWLKNFLNLTSAAPVYIMGLGILMLFLLTPPRSILQGTQKFKDLSLNSIIEVVFKIMFTSLFVLIGWGVGGAVGGIAAGSLVAYLFSFWPIKFILEHRSDDIKLEIWPILKESVVILISLISLTLFYTLDVVLVKHFLDAETAGQYGGLAIMGRIIFYVSGAIAAVMFSMSAEIHQQNQEASAKVLQQSAILVILLSASALLVYFLFPGLVITILLGGKFLAVKSYLGRFALAMAFYSLVNLLSQYFIAVGKKKFVLILLAGIVVLGFSISLWHQTIGQVVAVMDIVTGLVLLALLVYYFIARKVRKVSLN